MIVSAVDAQTLVDAVGLGAVYALMAVGIGLVFGMLRLVNFAYGQLIMAGAYTLAFTSGWPVAGSVLACFGVVIALSFLMDGVVFRPLRTQSPAVMLVTTFAVAFLLQAVALILDIRDGTIGEPAVSVASLNEVVTVHGVDIRKVTILAVVVAIVALGLLALLLGRTTIGLQMRAAVDRLPHRPAARRQGRPRHRRRRAAIRRRSTISTTTLTPLYATTNAEFLLPPALDAVRRRRRGAAATRPRRAFASTGLHPLLRARERDLHVRGRA